MNTEDETFLAEVKQWAESYNSDRPMVHFKEAAASDFDIIEKTEIAVRDAVAHGLARVTPRLLALVDSLSAELAKARTVTPEMVERALRVWFSAPYHCSSDLEEQMSTYREENTGLMCAALEAAMKESSHD